MTEANLRKKKKRGRNADTGDPTSGAGRLGHWLHGRLSLSSPPALLVLLPVVGVVVVAVLLVPDLLDLVHAVVVLAAVDAAAAAGMRVVVVLLGMVGHVKAGPFVGAGGTAALHHAAPAANTVGGIAHLSVSKFKAGRKIPPNRNKTKI